MTPPNKKNGKIEFLRFYFAIMVVFQHSWHFLGFEISPFPGGSFAVEFFFLVSGYLMMCTVMRREQQPDSEPIGKETLHFILKKASVIFPEALVAWFIAFAITAFSKGWGVGTAIHQFLLYFWELIFLSMTGLGKMGINTAVWYISAMLIWMMVLYPLLRKHRDIMVHIVLPLSSLFVLGFLFRKFPNPRDPSKWIGLCYKGLLRAYAELSIGILLYYPIHFLQSLSFRPLGRWLITLVENGIYLLIFVFMAVAGAGDYDYFLIMLLSVAITLTFSDAGMDGKLFRNRLSYALGRFSIPIYLSHLFYAYYINLYVSVEHSIGMRLAVYFAVSFATAFAVMFAGKAIRKLLPKIKTRAASLLLEQ